MAHGRETPNAEVLAIGNSLIAAGFNERAFNLGMQLRDQKGSVNLGLGGSTPVEQLLLFRYALSHQMHPQVLIYGFYDFQLTAPIELTTQDIIGNHALLYYLEPEFGRHFYHLSHHDALEFEIMRHFPMFAQRGAVWARVEKLRRQLAEMGLPEEKVNHFGRSQDFSALEAANASEFTRQCESESGRGLNAPIQELIREAKRAGLMIVFVEMPMHPRHIDTFYESSAWKQYRSHLHALMSSQDVKYVDASHWITDENLFADHLHLTDAGGGRFSERLGRLLSLSGKARE
jgi:hypothetical protein